eukprot:8882730-Ditylum_brightwellii.AAC.1
MEDDLKEDMQYMQQQQDNRFTGYLSMISNNDTSNKERQQWHQDQDAVTKIQCIVCGFIQQKFNFASLKQQSAVIIQA